MAPAVRVVGLIIFACVLGSCAHPAGKTDVADLGPRLEESQTAIEPRLVTYKITASRDLKLHVFEPPAKRYPGTRPAALILHGGGWREGSPQRFYDQARHIAERGMVAIAAEYRLASIDGTEPDKALEDAGSAIRFIRANAKSLRLDPERLVAIGGSAGGHLAAALATVEGFDDPRDDGSVSKRPAALVLYNPVIDNGPQGYGHDRVGDYWQAFSPIDNIAPGHPPTLVLLGTRDDLVPVETAERHCGKVRAVGSECTLLLYEGQPHAFYSRRRSERYYRETTEAMDSFLVSLGYL